MLLLAPENMYYLESKISESQLEFWFLYPADYHFTVKTIGIVWNSGCSITCDSLLIILQSWGNKVLSLGLVSSFIGQEK